MSIFDRAGPLGEKLRGQSNNIFKNLENAAPQLEDLAARGTSLLKSILGLGGSGETLNYPLDVEGNPAYAATVEFQVVEFTSAVPGKSQKSHIKQADDNLKEQLKAQDAANNAAAGLGTVDSFEDRNPGFKMVDDTEFANQGIGAQPIINVDDTAARNVTVGTTAFSDDASSSLAGAKKDNKAETAQLKKVSNTISPLGFFPVQQMLQVVLVQKVE